MPIMASASQLLELNNKILDLTRQRDMYQALYQDTLKDLAKARIRAGEAPNPDDQA